MRAYEGLLALLPEAMRTREARDGATLVAGVLLHLWTGAGVPDPPREDTRL